MGVSVEGLKCEAAIIKIGDRTWKITKIALNNLGAWLQLQRPCPWSNICDRACQDRAQCPSAWDSITDFSFWWAVGWMQWSGYVGRSRGLPGRASGFSLLDAVSKGCNQPFLSRLLIKSPLCPRKKIKKSKEIWILFSISLTKIKLHF
jgi:hypothetical protein